jgi:hypothetical protein
VLVCFICFPVPTTFRILQFYEIPTKIPIRKKRRGDLSVQLPPRSRRKFDAGNPYDQLFNEGDSANMLAASQRDSVHPEMLTRS